MWSGLPRNISISAHDWSQVLTFQVIYHQCVESVKERMGEHGGKLAQSSDKSNRMIDILAQ